MTGDLYSFSAEAGDRTRQGLPPVVGHGPGSSWLAGAGFLKLPQFPLPSAEDPFFLGIDVQPDSHAEQVFLGCADGDSLFELRVGGMPGAEAVTVAVRDSARRELVVRARLSPTAARRLLITGICVSNRIAVHELQPWASRPGFPLDTEVVRADGPRSLPRPSFGLALGGSLVNGKHKPGSAGRLAEFFIGRAELRAGEVRALAAATDNPSELQHDLLTVPSREMVERFQRDLARARRMRLLPTWTSDELDDASLLLYRWLFDKRPIVPALATTFGVQLWLPGMSDRELNYLRVVSTHTPTFRMTGAMGPESSFGFKWVTLSAWSKEAAFNIGSHEVSNESFVKFVRNKLGGGHFDEHDRTKWQRELLGITNNIELLGHDSLVYQMRGVLNAVLFSVASCRIDARAEAAGRDPRLGT